MRDRLTSQQAGAQTRCVLAELGGDYPRRLLPNEKFVEPAAERLKEFFAGARHSAADDDQFWSQQRRVGGQSTSEGVDGVVPDHRGDLVARRHQFQYFLGPRR